MSMAGQVSLVDSPVEKTTEIKRIVVSSVIGTAVEWYDFLIYGTASALVFNKLFFPLSDPALGTIAAFGTYGVGFLARPLGAAIFGHFGDRVGRKAMLAMTIIIMGLGTFLVGLLPTYDQIGIAAPVLLVLLRGATRRRRAQTKLGAAEPSSTKSSSAGRTAKPAWAEPAGQRHQEPEPGKRQRG